MRRRALLATAAASVPALSAGCAASPNLLGGRNGGAETPTARLELTTVPDAELPAEVLRTVRRADGDEETARLLDRILDGGETTEARQPPLPEQRHIAYRDTVYELSYEVIAETPATRYSVKVGLVGDSMDETAAVEFAELPAVDREKFAARGLADGETVGIGTTFLYMDAERERSVLVPESGYSYVTWDDGNAAEWAVENADDTTLNTYRYTAEEVATAADYGRRMRERFTFELSGLPEAQRDIVDTAVADGQYTVGADERPSDAFAALVDRFQGHERAGGLDGLDRFGEDDLSGTYLVRYRNDVYWAVLIVRRDAFRTPTG